MRNKAKNQRFYRCPKTTQERRANCRYGDGWGRAKRNSKNLVDTYDDKPTCVQRTWKVRRKKQYHNRGKQHKVFIPHESFWGTWELERYFEDHEIPYRIEKVETVHTEMCHYSREYKRLRYDKYTYVRKVRIHGSNKKHKTRLVTETGWKPIYGWVYTKLEQPRLVRHVTLHGYNVFWWSNKNIGIDYILRKHTPPC